MSKRYHCHSSRRSPVPQLDAVHVDQKLRRVAGIERRLASCSQTFVFAGCGTGMLPMYPDMFYSVADCL